MAAVNNESNHFGSAPPLPLHTNPPPLLSCVKSWPRQAETVQYATLSCTVNIHRKPDWALHKEKKTVGQFKNIQHTIMT